MTSGIASADSPSKSPPASASRSSPFTSFLTLIFVVPIALYIYLVVHGPGLEQQLLPPEYAHLVRNAVEYSRAAVIEVLKGVGIGECELGDICRLGQKRPTLKDGRESSAMWDLPRKLMKEKFRSVQAIIPEAKVSYMWEEPLVVYYDNVLTEEDIDMIIDMATPRFETSKVVDKDGNAVEDESRTSSTAWLFMNEDEKFKQLVKKVTALAGFTEEHSEHIGVNRYDKAQFFNPHHDFLEEDQLTHGEFLGCQRSTTALIYLSDVIKGGETVFVREGGMDGRFDFDKNNPDHLVIKPKKGRVLLWYNMHPYTEKVDYRTLHGGAPVVDGVKIAATIFVRNCTRQETQETVAEPSKQDDVDQNDVAQNDVEQNDIEQNNVEQNDVEQNDAQQNNGEQKEDL